MDWADTPEQASFREEVRSFIQGNLPAYYADLAAKGGVITSYSIHYTKLYDDRIRSEKRLFRLYRVFTASD